MSRMTLGDMAQSFQLRRDNARLKTDMMRLAQEMSTGRKADISTAVAGDSGPIAGIERQLGTLKAYGSVTTDAKVFAGGMQIALERVHTLSDNLAPQLMLAEGNGNSRLSDGLVMDAVHAFQAAVISFNGQVAGRSLFGGVATDISPLADPDTMLADLRALTATETTAAGVIAKLDTWFGAGGGFETVGYVGSTTDIEPFRVAEGTDVRAGVRADDPTIREMLKGLALAALTDPERSAHGQRDRTFRAGPQGRGGPDDEPARLCRDAGAGRFGRGRDRACREPEHRGGDGPDRHAQRNRVGRSVPERDPDAGDRGPARNPLCHDIAPVAPQPGGLSQMIRSRLSRLSPVSPAR